MKQKERLIELLDECRCINGAGIDLMEKKADFLIRNGVMIPPVQTGQTVYSLGKKYSKCQIGCIYDEFNCQGCCLPTCDSHPTYFIEEEMVTALIWSNGRWTVRTNKTWGMQEKGIENHFGYDVFLSSEKISEEIERREKRK